MPFYLMDVFDEPVSTKLVDSGCIESSGSASTPANAVNTAACAAFASCFCMTLGKGSLQSRMFATAEHSLPVTLMGQKEQSKVGTRPADHAATQADLNTAVIKTAGPDDAQVDSGDDCGEESSTSDDEDACSYGSRGDYGDPIDVYRQLEEAAECVCHVLVHPLNLTATGFLVGNRHLVTALHTMKDCLVFTCSSHSGAAGCGGRHCAGRCWELQKGVVVIANFSFHDGNFWSSEHELELRRRPAAVLEGVDAIVLEFDLCAASSVPSFPKCGFQKNSLDFSKSPITAGSVYLVGHNRASPKQMDCCGLAKTADYALLQLDRYHAAVKLEDARMQKDLHAEDSLLVQGGQYVFVDCFFMNGASGCPVFRYDGPTGSLKLVAMFLCGLPSGHYLMRPKGDDAAAAYDKAMRRSYRTFEAGVTMAALRAELRELNPRLAAEFGW